MRRIHRPLSLKLICTAVLGLAVTASGRNPSESFLQQGIELLDRDHFADSVAMLTRALDQNPKDTKAYYYRALANEMVDRQAAIGDWHSFVELVAMDPEAKQEVTQAQARLQVLKKMPRLPESLRASRYVPKAGDYYQESAEPADELLWTQFPVTVYVDNPPEKWRAALQDALSAWNDIVPLRRVLTRQDANITMRWASLQGGRLGSTEQSLIQVRWEGDRVFQRLDTASIVLDNSHRWSGPEMRFTLLHELGHALGINHSKGSKDVMIPILHETITEPPTNLSVAGTATRLIQFPDDGSSVHINAKLTRRDVNTLVRLYNCSGPVVHLK